MSSAVNSAMTDTSIAQVDHTISSSDNRSDITTQDDHMINTGSHISAQADHTIDSTESHMTTQADHMTHTGSHMTAHHNDGYVIDVNESGEDTAGEGDTLPQESTTTDAITDHLDSIDFIETCAKDSSHHFNGINHRDMISASSDVQWSILVELDDSSKKGGHLYINCSFIGHLGVQMCGSPNKQCCMSGCFANKQIGGHHSFKALSTLCWKRGFIFYILP